MNKNQYDHRINVDFDDRTGMEFYDMECEKRRN